MSDPDTEKCKACSYGPPDWQYKCLDCTQVFKLPAPRGPSDEKNRRCPNCDSPNIERINVVKSEACPPGG
ncbi:MAG: hypothetical protein PVG61_06380 [Dehalococcoidia bacterium]